MNRLLIAIVIAIGLAFGSVVVFEGDMAQVAFVGTFFLKALKMIIVPLIFFSMVSGITSLGDVRKLGRLGGRTVLYYACTTLIAVVLGTIMVNLFQPGVGLDQSSLPQGEMPAKAVGASDILLSFVHDNIIQAAADLKMLPIIVFSMLFGAVLTTIGDKGRPVIAFCEGGNEAMMKIVHIIMYLAPIGIFGLVAGTFGKHIVEAGGLEGFYELLDKLASYMVPSPNLVSHSSNTLASSIGCCARDSFTSRRAVKSSPPSLWRRV